METEVKINGENLKLLKYKNFKIKDEEYVVFINPDDRDVIFLMKETKDGFEPVFNMNKETEKLFFDEVGDLLAFGR